MYCSKAALFILKKQRFSAQRFFTILPINLQSNKYKAIIKQIKNNTPASFNKAIRQKKKKTTQKHFLVKKKKKKDIQNRLSKVALNSNNYINRQMQVISNPNGIDSQHQMLLNLFQNFIEIHSEDYENQSNLSQLRKQMNQNIKREWNYFKCQINVNPLNTDKITTYFHLLEKSLLENNSLDNSPSHSPTIRPSQHQKDMSESSKSPNTRFLTINPNDVPKDAFKKNCFKRSTNAAQNRINLNSNSNDETAVPSNRIQQTHGYFSPQIQPSSDRQFSQMLQQFEQNTMKNARSPYYNQSSQVNQHNFTSAVQSSNQDPFQQQKNNFIKPSQFQQQQGYQNNYQIQINSSSNTTSENNAINQQRGLIKVDESNFNSPPIFPLETVNNQQQLQLQQQQQVLSKLDSEENSASNSESSSTRNSQDIINNVSNSQPNNNPNGNMLNANQSPTLNNTQSNTSLQIENLKNQAQQFYKEYKSQQIDSQRSTQQDTSKNIVQNVNLINPQSQQIGNQKDSSSIQQQFQQPIQQVQSPIIPISYNISYDQEKYIATNPQIQVNIQGNNQGQQHSHSLDYNQQNLNKLAFNNFHQYRALSPNPQSTQNNNLQFENRTYSPNSRLYHNPQMQNFSQQQQQLQPPQKQTKNALNYKNKLLQAANQAVPLNQYQVGQQQKSDQSINSNSSSNLSMTTNNLTQPQSLAQQYGMQENQSTATVQRYQSPLRQISSINSLQQINQNQQQQTQQQPVNNIAEQQSIIDEMLRYQFKIKQVLEKTQLLETYMKNNSSAINSLFNQ
ncbi:hypothetical protein TTHERM_00001160 (macronuclear) [Tetrahymena thermophila SB210]|uniref:Uncharacterized protein n=1 Tax=Tetrahymena thermophila (strain SB210) TaxID=312017 RepID=Q22SM1_TETTS|nr:hypothetical protein TTHERM_00001160 [Tetrahymena thermophila SB210]EAR87751.2 hypothetical protein TTHERM_00001160 [Tetrahymena thermophila SB210]|eukprot:XP_001007996.2 hypothetical protein TTHERM_00001160 [Tetrahymena thermophila SB210]